MSDQKSSKTVTVSIREAADRRLSERSALRFRVVIRYRRLCFRSFTSDVSVGGLKLADQIPQEFIENICEIFISDERNGENIKFDGKVFKDPKMAKRIQFEVSAQKNADRLAVWIQHHSKKKAAK